MIHVKGEDFIAIVNPIREQKGWSKSEFCKRIGVSNNMWSNYAKGSEPKYSVIEATEKCLGIRFSDYKVAKEAVFPQEDEMTALLSDLRNREDMRMLFKLAHGATKEDVEQAVKIIEALRK